MSTSYIRRSSGGPAPSALTGNDSPIGVDTDNDRLYFVTSDRAGSSRKKPIASSNVRLVTASMTANGSDDGTVFVADSTTSVIVSLPATQLGLRYTLVVGQVTSAAGHAFSPTSTDKIMGNGFTAADDKDLLCPTATDREGDAVTIVGDGSLGWYIVNVTGTWTNP